MQPFRYMRADAIEGAVREVVSEHGAKFIAGGTNLVDLMKGGIERPSELVDITRLALRQVTEREDGGVSIGALVSNADLAYHPEIERRYPLLSSAILAGASPQLRNMATTGGNLLQRTRCSYFYDLATPCNKRAPASGCSAREGYNRMHAILGASQHCVATHPSDMCVALAALDAQIKVRGPQGERVIPFHEFHRLPSDTPHIDTNLAPSELILSVELPANDLAAHSRYLKIRDRASYAFALVSVAAAVVVHEGKISEARIALGGVSHKPWRVREAEQVLNGKPVTEEYFRLAAKRLLEGAQPLAHNAFKDRARGARHRACVGRRGSDGVRDGQGSKMARQIRKSRGWPCEGDRRRALRRRVQST